MAVFYREYHPSPPPPPAPVPYLLPEKLLSRVRPIVDVPGVVAASIFAAELLAVSLDLTPPIPKDIFTDIMKLVYMSAVGFLGAGRLLNIKALTMKSQDEENKKMYELLMLHRMRMPREFKGIVPDEALSSNFGNIHMYHVPMGKQFPQPREALKLAALDLATIAEQCEHNDPQVEGISYFGGETTLQRQDILGKRLTGLGFTEHKGYGMPRLTKWDSFINGRRPWTEQYERERGIKVPGGDSALILISRGDLIKQRFNLQVLANKLN